MLDLVSLRGFVGLEDLVREVQASESTVRRDLDFWHKQGVLKRTRGGAVFLGDHTTLPALEERLAQQLEEKRLIAQATVARIQDGDAVLLDGGTTTLEVARLLVDRAVQIVTNSLPIANLLSNGRQADLILLGGYVYPKTGVALGPMTVRTLDEVHVNQTIMSVSGVTAKGLFNSNLLLVETEQHMMRCADEVVVLADHSKVGRPALAFLCELNAIDTMIVDAGITTEQRHLLTDAGPRLIVAGEKNNEGFDA
ncbi:MAG: DeoR/GlpR family DNA-binding transcription regulator [Gemmataceae bacterium]|nr:DeoR/GlpR family DNA-binding transcription regulator [Gemmataceae bacterium]